MLFNVVTYSLLFAELVLFAFADPSDSDKVRVSVKCWKFDLQQSIVSISDTIAMV